MTTAVNSNPRSKIPEGGPGTSTGRITPDNALLVSLMHGRMYELCRIGNLFYGGNQADHLVSTHLNLTCTGLIIENPAGNNKDVILEAFGYVLGLAEAAVSHIGLAAGYSGAALAGVTSLVFGTAYASLNFGNGAAPTAKLHEHATLVAPRFVMGVGLSALATAIPGSSGFFDLHGAIRLQPGAWAAINALTAVQGSGTFWWSEEDR